MVTYRGRRLVLAQIEVREKIEADCKAAARVVLVPPPWPSHLPRRVTTSWRCSVCRRTYPTTRRAGACCEEAKAAAFRERQRWARQRKAAVDVRTHRNTTLYGLG